MKNVLFSLLVAFAIAAPAAQATTIGFEDLHPTNCCSFIEGTYHGLNWSGGEQGFSWVIANESVRVFAGDTTHSGTAYAWSNGGTTLSLSGPAFTLESLWLRASDVAQITFTGFTDGVQVFSSTMDATSTYQLATLNFADIDTLFINSNNRNILIDDISIAANAVPEPATGAMMLLGLGLLGFLRRKAK